MRLLYGTARGLGPPQASFERSKTDLNFPADPGWVIVHTK
jgi:hypothetical protein